MVHSEFLRETAAQVYNEAQTQHRKLRWALDEFSHRVGDRFRGNDEAKRKFVQRWGRTYIKEGTVDRVHKPAPTRKLHADTIDAIGASISKGYTTETGTKEPYTGISQAVRLSPKVRSLIDQADVDKHYAMKRVKQYHPELTRGSAYAVPLLSTKHRQQRDRWARKKKRQALKVWDTVYWFDVSTIKFLLQSPYTVIIDRSLDTGPTAPGNQTTPSMWANPWDKDGWHGRYMGGVGALL
jgi:hypothetical protein